jgi:hypothetical protein
MKRIQGAIPVISFPEVGGLTVSSKTLSVIAHGTVL